MKKLNQLLEDTYKINIEKEIKKVSMNSKDVEENTLFFAINNGNLYIEEAIQSGAILVVADNVEEPIYEKYKKKIIIVDDTIKEMQNLAKKYRNILDITVIAITGSNGKTSTKDILYSIISTKYPTKKTEGNYNNHIGLPFTILNLDDDDKFSILEMGMSSFGEIDLLGNISQPDYAIITNIGESHLETLKTKENIFKAKTEILKYVDIENVFVCGDDEMLSRTKANKVGFKLENDYLIKDFEIVGDKKIFFKLNNKKFESNLLGKHSAVNISLCIALAEKIGISYDDILAAISNIKVTKMRFEIEKIGNDIYINDAYNASPTSMKAAIETFANMYNDKFKVLILGDMLELGEHSEKFHEDIVELATKNKNNLIILYGNIMKKIHKDMDCSEKIKFFDDKYEILKFLENIDKSKAILIKASNGTKLFELVSIAKGEKK